METIVNEKIWTPWVFADHRKEYAAGIVQYSTPGHGGMKVRDDLNRKIPEYMRNKGGWYEEDCEWSKVVAVFPDKFGSEEVEIAKRTFRDWFPEEYEKFYGVRLKAGESYERDCQLYLDSNRGNYLTRAAWGNWHKTVPEGMVGICAVPGTKYELSLRAELPEDEIWVLIPESEYQNAEGSPYAFDAGRYQKWKTHA